MKKSIIFVMLIIAFVLSLCGSVAAADNNTLNTTTIPQYNHVYINVSNEEGVKYNIDYDYYLNDPTYSQGGSNGSYYIKAEGGGLNQLHICNSNGTSSNLNYGQIIVNNTTSGSQSGVFYITTTGGRGSNDEIILLLSVKGPIDDKFNVTIVSSGYTWIISTFGAVQPPLPTNPQYVVGAVNETFTKSDFLYGPQTTRPAPSGWQPLYSGQNTSDNSTAEYLMFIDLYVGNLKSGLTQAPIDNGAVKVEYTINNMYTTASFNAYAWTGASFQGTGINWCNPIINNANPCVVTVNYKPVTPVANFTADSTSGSDSLTVKFTDTSSNYPLSWIWDFGDGTTSTEQKPTHIYSAPGKYTVKLTAINPAGNDTKTIVDFITVLDTIAPTVSANPLGGNYSANQTVTLTTTDASSTTTYYTTDGSDPKTSSTRTVYSGPVTISNTTTLKFAAVDAANNWSPVYNETYNIKSDVYVQIIPSITNPKVGDKVTYKFKLGNNGPGIGKDVVFTYVIPDDVQFAGASLDQGNYTYNETTRTLTWNLGDVAVGDPNLWLNLTILKAGSFNILPTVSVAGYNPGLTGNIGSLAVNAVSVPVSEATVSAYSNTIPMQNTGVPLTGLISALVLVGSGLALSRRK